MTHQDIEDKIAALLKAAEPLRALDTDDPQAEPLAGIIDQINALRAKQDLMARMRGIEEPAPAVPAIPTRTELEVDAFELGIKFDGRTTDAKLAEKIAAKRAT